MNVELSLDRFTGYGEKSDILKSLQTLTPCVYENQDEIQGDSLDDYLNLPKCSNYIRTSLIPTHEMKLNFIDSYMNAVINNNNLDTKNYTSTGYEFTVSNNGSIVYDASGDLCDIFKIPKYTLGEYIEYSSKYLPEHTANYYANKVKLNIT